MAGLSKVLDHNGRQRIEAALKAADARTSGEIIPVLIRRSAPYGHVAWTAGALILGLVEGVLLSAGAGVWAGRPWNAAGLLLACAALGWAAARAAWVRRALTPRGDAVLAVHRSAEAAFHRLGLHRAREDAGVLLYVSWEERRAVVLAGPGIADLAGTEHWTRTCALLTRAAAAGDLAAGFEAAIAHAADALARAHPNVEGQATPVLGQRLRLLHESF